MLHLQISRETLHIYISQNPTKYKNQCNSSPNAFQKRTSRRICIISDVDSEYAIREFWKFSQYFSKNQLSWTIQFFGHDQEPFCPGSFSSS